VGRALCRSSGGGRGSCSCLSPIRFAVSFQYAPGSREGISVLAHLPARARRNCHLCGRTPCAPSLLLAISDSCPLTAASTPTASRRVMRDVSSQKMVTRPSDEVLKEGDRLGRLLFGVSSLDEAIARLGPPDRDTSTQHPVVEGNVPRIVVWLNCSATFAMVGYIEPDGHFAIRGEERSLWL